MCQFLLASVPSTYLTLGLAASGQKLDLVSELYFCRCLLQNVYRIKKKKSVHMYSLLYYIGNGMKGSAVLLYLLLTLFSNVCFFLCLRFSDIQRNPQDVRAPLESEVKFLCFPIPRKQSPFFCFLRTNQVQRRQQPRKVSQLTLRMW